MSDIELVVKIPEEMYKKISNSNPSYADDFSIYYAVKNGKPLPKGHGRLFDEKDIVSGNYEVIGNRIYELEPIIEAYKESK